MTETRAILSPLACDCDFIAERFVAKLINRKTGRIETAQEWLGHTSTAFEGIHLQQKPLSRTIPTLFTAPLMELTLYRYNSRPNVLRTYLRAVSSK